MNNKGYIKLYRKVFENWVYGLDEQGRAVKPFDEGHAWIDLLLMANFEETKKMYRGSIQVTQPGQIQTSIESLAYRWRWDRKKVSKFLTLLENDKMVTTNRTPNGTTVTLENWAFLQGHGTAKGTANGTADGTAPAPHNKNIRNKEIKNPLNPPTGDGGGASPLSDEEAEEERLRDILRRIGKGETVEDD